MVTTDVDKVLNITISPVGESVDVAWRTITITTETGKVEIVMSAADPDNLLLKM